MNICLLLEQGIGTPSLDGKNKSDKQEKDEGCRYMLKPFHYLLFS